MWPELIASVLTGLTGLVVAAAGLMTARSRGSGEALTRCRQDLDRTERQLVASLRHMHRLERILANSGTAVPPRPQELRELVS